MPAVACIPTPAAGRLAKGLSAACGAKPCCSLRGAKDDSPVSDGALCQRRDLTGRFCHGSPEAQAFAGSVAALLQLGQPLASLEPAIQQAFLRGSAAQHDVFQGDHALAGALPASPASARTQQVWVPGLSSSSNSSSRACSGRAD